MTNDNTGDSPKFSFRGESNFSYIINIPFVFILFFVLPFDLILEGNAMGISIGTGIILLFSLFLYRKLVLKVSFFADNFVVKYLMREKKFNYDSVEKIYYNREGFSPYHVYVIKFNAQNSNKKATFYCSEKEFDDVALFLQDKKVVADKIGKSLLGRRQK